MRKGEIIGVERFQEAQRLRDEKTVSPLDVEPDVVFTFKPVRLVDPDSYFNPRVVATELPRGKRVRSRKAPNTPRA